MKTLRGISCFNRGNRLPLADRASCAADALSTNITSYVELLVCLQIASKFDPEKHTQAYGGEAKVTPSQMLKIVAVTMIAAATHAGSVSAQQGAAANNLFTASGFVVQYANTPRSWRI